MIRTSRVPLLSLLLFTAALLFSPPMRAQDPVEGSPAGGRDASGRPYNCVLRIAPEAAARYGGHVIVSGVMIPSGSNNLYRIRLQDGTEYTIPRADVEAIETYSGSLRSPSYNDPNLIPCCTVRDRTLPWYFAELRTWGYLTGADSSIHHTGLRRFTFGPEAVLGLRFGNFGAGLGVSWLQYNDINRYPAFLHFRYQLSCACLSPFVYAQAGTVFDDQSGVNALDPSNMFSTGPAMAGLGIGLDFAISQWNDLSVDIGYRYLHYTTSLPIIPPGGTAPVETIFHNESHGLLARIGWTF
jgi:hypothetical protein